MLSQLESVKFRRDQGPDGDRVVVIAYPKDGGAPEAEYWPDWYFDELYDWADWYDVDWEEYFG